MAIATGWLDLNYLQPPHWNSPKRPKLMNDIAAPTSSGLF